MSEFKLTINQVKQLVEETCHLVKKTNNDFSIEESDLPEILEEEDQIEKDEDAAYNVFVDIYNRINDEDIAIYPDEIKDGFLIAFDKFFNDLDEDDIEKLDELVSIDMTKEKKKEKVIDKKEKKDKKESLVVTFAEVLRFFNNVKECVDNQDVLIDEDVVEEVPGPSTAIEIIQNIFKELDDDDVEELNEDSQDFYNKYKNSKMELEAIEEKKVDKKEKVKKEKKDKKDKKEKKDTKKKEDPKPEDGKNEDVDKNDNDSNDSKEDDKEFPVHNTGEKVKFNIPENGCCGVGSCSEKTLILKGDASIIEAVTKLLETMSK